MKKLIDIVKDRSFKLTILLTLIYFGIGFAFLNFGLSDYGWIFFVLLPYSLGIAVGKMERQKWAYLGLAIGLIIFVVLLLAGGLEGIVCVVMSVPIVIPLVWLGVLTNKYLIKKGRIKQSNNLKVLTLPLLFFLFGAPIEKFFYTDKVEVIEVKTERIYPYTTEQVYNTIKSVDTLIADKSFLMKLDLPIPSKCILEKEEVGGLRTCYFSGGTITERITELDKAKVLRMDVIDYKLTGIKLMLTTKSQIYKCQPEPMLLHALS
ncbi:MAG: polyketide cyclase [Ginsengibacter sp.]